MRLSPLRLDRLRCSRIFSLRNFANSLSSSSSSARLRMGLQVRQSQAQGDNYFIINLSTNLFFSSRSFFASSLSSVGIAAFSMYSGGSSPGMCFGRS